MCHHFREGLMTETGSAWPVVCGCGTNGYNCARNFHNKVPSLGSSFPGGNSVFQIPCWYWGDSELEMMGEKGLEGYIFIVGVQ